MSNYDTYIEEIDAGVLSEEALEASADALGFVQALHNMFRENGYDMPEDPEVSLLENAVDGMVGELSAASFFLSEDSFANAPELLRGISRAFSITQSNPKTVVPTVVVKGYDRLANRIEATRVQKQQMKELLDTQNSK